MSQAPMMVGVVRSISAKATFLIGILTLLVLQLGAPTVAFGQSLPSMQILTAPLISPAAAQTSYGTSTTHTNSLAGVAGFGATAPEIVETARALKNNPDVIYDFVHNEIEVEYAFGMRKGALGALINKSGTPFDQNALFVALVRQAGYTAQYQISQVTIQAADFTNWTGISDIQAACRLLSSGGIPATFNGQSSWASDCSQTGTLTSVTMLHVWSQVQIGGTWYAYDPSFKTYAGPAPQNLFNLGGFTAGAAAAQAASTIDSGTQSGSNYIHNASTANLDAYLAARGSQLLSGLRGSTPALDTRTVVGITKIAPVYAPASGWRNTTPTGYTVGTGVTITGDIPDQYRAKLQVTIQSPINDGITEVTLLNWLFYVDDIDGRRLGYASSFLNSSFTNGFPGYNGFTLPPQTFSLVVDDVPVQQYTCTPGAGNTYPCPVGQFGTATVTASHPYLAISGTYGSQTVTKNIATLAAPFAIVSGWGSISPDLLTKWSSELASDAALPIKGTPPRNCNEADPPCWDGPLRTPAGDFSRQKVAAGWLAQMTRMLEIQAMIGGAKGDHQHSIGLVDWNAQFSRYQYPVYPSVPNTTYFGIVGTYTELHVASAISISAYTADLSKVDAIVRATALSSATLEGSMLEQTEDLADTGSTATRFAWANQPDEDPCPGATARKFFDFTGSSSSNRASIYQYEGSASGCGAAPTITGGTPSNWASGLEWPINQYLAAGFNVTSSAETFLGPGARYGAAIPTITCDQNDACGPVIYESYNPSQQRGGAIIATRYANGHVAEIANVLTTLNINTVGGILKGGGGKDPSQSALFDPTKAADILKDRFVDRSVELGVNLKTGTAGYTTPTLLSIGAGSEPYQLAVNMSFNAAPNSCAPAYGPCTGPVQGGWAHNWDIRFNNSGSGLEALGVTSPFAAAGSLTAFVAMQDIFESAGRSNLEQDVYAALAADWWRQQMVANVATMNRGLSGQQYVRMVDGTWLAPIGQPGTLVQTGMRTKVRDTCNPDPGQQLPLPVSRRWDFSNVSFALTSAAGDQMNFGNWSWNWDGNNICNFVYGYKPINWTFPQGPTLTFTYDYKQGVTGVSSNLGRSLTFSAFEGQMPTATGAAASGQVTVGNTGANAAFNDAANDNWSVILTAPMARTATQRPVPYPQLSQLFEPVNPSVPALQYGYDSRGLVNQAWDATALQWQTRGPYVWYLALGGRGERDDPNGGAYTVYFNTDGDAVRYIDEIGREVDGLYDGRHRISTRTYPEGDQSVFGYDANDNVTSFRRNAKPGSPLAALLVTADYDPTWNKIAHLTDARGCETTFTYYPPGSFAGGAAPGELSQVQRCAVNSQTPTYTYQYNGIGLQTQAVDATGVTTTSSYDSAGNLLSKTEGAAAVGSAPALNLTTNYTPDAVGNVVTTTDPRGYAEAVQYDNMHRQTDAQQLNGGTSALPLTAQHFVYDGNGRQTGSWQATGFQSTAPYSATGWLQTLTSYTPTGKVASTTDPLGNVTRTTYDALDRSLRVMDASGRVTSSGYDLAGQLLQERHAVGTPLEQAYATYTYTPNGNKASVADALWPGSGTTHTIQYTYDGFDRLSVTTYGDGTTEQSVYDPNGNVTTWTNRKALQIQRVFDPLNRKTSEIGSTNGVPNQNVSTWNISNRSFSYDLAGRPLTANNATWSETSTYDAAGRLSTFTNPLGTFTHGWDAASNLASTTYGNGFQAGYVYDGVNRLSNVTIKRTSDPSPIALATINYDTLSRRQTVTFTADGSSVGYSFDNADRLLTLSHGFVTTSNNFTETASYDPAGKRVSDTFSDPALQWTINLNPTSSIPPLTYNYDEFNQLAQVISTASTYGQYTPDALGRLTQRVAIQQGGTDSQAYMSGDGVHDQDVADSLYQRPNGATPWTSLGSRSYVPGPDPDERLAFIDADGTIRIAHINMIGTLVALSQGGNPVLKLATGPWGESTAAVSAATGATAYPYRYTGQRQDVFANLYDYKARSYMPATGRFMQTDPTGTTDNINLYAYVGDDPIDGSDPSGLVDPGCGSRVGNDPSCKSYPGAASELASAEAQKKAAPSSGKGGNTTILGMLQTGFDSLNDKILDAQDQFLGAVSDPGTLASIGLPIGPDIALFEEGAEALEAAATSTEKAVGKLVADGCGCFVAGTLVETDHGLEPIEQIKVGERVRSRDEKSGKTAYKHVLALIRPHGRAIFRVLIGRGGGEREAFDVTDDHPWMSREGRWMTTVQLSPGIELKTEDGVGAKVISAIDTRLVADTYNLDVEHSHTFFVGKMRIWVHNANCPEGFLKAGGAVKNVVKNKQLLEQLRSSGGRNWSKVYQDGWLNGAKATWHYFQDESGNIFGSKVKWGWSNGE